MTTYKSTGNILFEKGGSRYASVMTVTRRTNGDILPGMVIDQYGRVFEHKPAMKNRAGYDCDGMKYVGVGSATH